MKNAKKVITVFVLFTTSLLQSLFGKEKKCIDDTNVILGIIYSCMTLYLTTFIIIIILGRYQKLQFFFTAWQCYVFTYTLPLYVYDYKTRWTIQTERKSFENNYRKWLITWVYLLRLKVCNISKDILIIIISNMC